MTMLASIAEVETLLGGQMQSDDESSYVLDLVIAASAAVEGYVGPVGKVDGDVKTWRANGPTCKLYLPAPVAAVDSVTVNGAGVSYSWATSGELELAAPVVFGDVVAVTFDHGYDAIPDEIRWTVARMAAAELVASRARITGNVQSETIGTYSVSYGPAPAPTTMLTADHRHALRRYRRAPSMLNIGSQT